jgi:DNA polymerase III subunit delta'
MYFKDVIGQKEIKDRFIQSVKNGRIPHAQLISGASGTGTLQLAIAFARYICCTDRGENDACGKCSSCRQFDKLVHPDVHFVFPIFKPNSSKKWVCDDFIKEWRKIVIEKGYFNYNQWMSSIKAGNAQGMIYVEESDELIHKLNLKAYESEYKVVIIWLPEKMHESCANKLLKLLEEPPSNTIFLMVTENSGQLLSTVISRSQIIRVHGISLDELVDALKTRFNIDEKECINYSRLAAGSYLEALECIETSYENTFFLEQFKRSMRGAYIIANFTKDRKTDKQNSLKDLKLWAEEMAKIGREQEKKYLSYAQRLVRENFIMNVGQKELNYLSPSESAFSTNFFPFINHKNIVAFMEEIELAEKHIESNVSAKLVFFDLALQSIMLFKK